LSIPNFGIFAAILPLDDPARAWYTVGVDGYQKGHCYAQQATFCPKARNQRAKLLLTPVKTTAFCTTARRAISRSSSKARRSAGARPRLRRGALIEALRYEDAQRGE
jgi:hypothetical protein